MTYEVTKSYNTSQESSNGSRASSRGSDTLIERLIAQRDGGREIEYDLPPDATSQDKARDWQLPARVLKSEAGSMQLLNPDQLEHRLDGWLKAHQWDRSICGRWIFTWNASHIECDTKAIIKRLEEIDLTSQELRDGAPYLDVLAIGPGHLVRTEDSSKGLTFSAMTRVDPDKVRLERAEADVAIGEMTRKPISLEAALRERSREQISGSISVIWETDDVGAARKRTRTTVLEVERSDGTKEKRTATETVERRPVRR